MKLLSFVAQSILATCFLGVASGNEARNAIRDYLVSKTSGGNPHPGMVCQSLGGEPARENCFNENGDSQCYAERWIDAFYNADKGSRDDFFNIQGAECDEINRNGNPEFRPGNICYEWIKAKVARGDCPYPCNCWLKSSPAVSGDQLLKYTTFQNPTFEEIKQVLRSWNVPEALDHDFEQATMFDSANFLNFHFYIQEDIRKTEYSINIGTARNVDGRVEMAFIQSNAAAELSIKVAVSTGGDTAGSYNPVVVDSRLNAEELEAVRQTLEFFALNSIDFGQHGIRLATE